MIKSSNDILRDKLSNANSEDIITIFESLNDDVKEHFFRLMLLDYYKIYAHFYNKKSNMFNRDIESLICMFFDDFHMTFDFIKVLKSFNDMPYISKCILIEKMSTNDYDKDLLEISKFHILDKITYQIFDDLDLYKEYYLDFIKQNKNEPDLNDNVVKFLNYRLHKLKNTDMCKYKKYSLEAMKVYYKWTVFIKDYFGEKILTPQDATYLKLIKNKNVDELLNYFDNNFTFSTNILGEYLYYSTSNTEIEESLVDNHLLSTSDKELKKKFNL